MQATVLWISVVAIAIVAALFIFVIRSSTRSASAQSVTRTAGTVRQVLFWGSLAAGAALLYVTLTPWPHGLPSAADEPIVVTVTGSQWNWEIDTPEVPTGKPIMFAVNSTDVNHGVGLYDENYTLLNQAQGMPGYTNRFDYTFSEPGTYWILCLEYCGLAHHQMIGELTVTSGTASLN